MARKTKAPAKRRTPSASFEIHIGTTRLRLREDALLGVGGEARVYRAMIAPGDERAVKIYHPLDARLRGSSWRVAEDQRQRRFDKIQAFPNHLPPAVIAPQELVHDAHGEPIGYAMCVVDGGHELSRLSRRPFREGVIDNARVTALFRDLYLTLAALHARGIVVGDLNDGNGLFTLALASPLTQAPRVWLIDADSMQIPGFACDVFHERTLDPRLYGVDLSRGDAYDAESDWYAFAVLFFSSLLYVHPYGGVHKSLPTLLRRAEARMSVLASEVRRPRVAVDPRVVGDDLYAYFSEVFDDDRRGIFPATLLELQWRRCARCGVEHVGSRCPVCSRRGTGPSVGSMSASTSVGNTKAAMLPTLVQVVDHGACRATTLFTTRGRVVMAARSLGKLCWIAADGGVLCREDGRCVLTQAPLPGMRFAIAGASTWIGHGERLVRVEGEQPQEQLQTACGLGGEAVFGASADLGCVHADAGWLVAARSGLRLGQIVAGQSWLRVSGRQGCGFYRAGALTIAFVFDGVRGGLTTLSLPDIQGRIVDAACAFDASVGGRVLLGIATERDGHRRHALYLLDMRGQILARLAGAPEDAPFLASVHGKALAGERVLSATEEGLVVLDATSGVLAPRRRFADTQPFIGAETALLSGPGGTIYATGDREIVQLRLLGPSTTTGASRSR